MNTKELSPLTIKYCYRCGNKMNTKIKEVNRSNYNENTGKPDEVLTLAEYRCPKLNHFGLWEQYSYNFKTNEWEWYTDYYAEEADEMLPALRNSKSIWGFSARLLDIFSM